MSKFDQNMTIQTTFREKDIRFYSANSEYVSLHGVWYENGTYRRMPKDVAKTISHGVLYGHALPAGGRVRFVTDSDFVAVHVEYGTVENSPKFPVAATAGIDVYEKNDGIDMHVGAFAPPLDMGDIYESDMKLLGKGEREITLYLPLYSEVKALYIGVKENAIMKQAPAYTHKKPVVYYGSSITHGACASRPGNTYEAMIMRDLDCDYVCLGFGGNAKGEPEMANYIASLEMSVFVLDYDYNAPNAEHLKNTHKNMFETIRKAQPTTPIIIVSRPKALDKAEQLRFDVVKATYDEAIAKGDANVYFIPGYELIPEEVMESAKVDRVHPNDLGFYYMKKRIGKTLESILNHAK